MKSISLILNAAAVVTLILAEWSFFSVSNLWVERKFLDKTNHLPRESEQAKVIFDAGFNAAKEIGASWVRSDARGGWIYLVQATVFATGGIAIERQRKSVKPPTRQ